MGMSHETILAYFKCLIDRAKKFKQVFFSQVDIPKSKRLKHMRALAEFVGITDQEWVETYARVWRPINVWPEQYAQSRHILGFDFATDWYEGKMNEDT